ncbi:MAG: UDP-N-acetylglucosamine--N-acetylmuramyl-(pentapeptide) pyrophosphoryl-undecaprenol N-acetylglucosamine transferase [Patescibacteria group bacterium]|nr:UDP-N-acetylglucosamine--N-acetylmuramyl-(pentapeptide) pyrophosphoryl-undecaprenol N-acetylglucosamine transferase [Patescibacteria group bacterium]
MKILVTGGHLSPALSVINELKEEDLLYVGRKYALEGDKVFSLEYQTIKDLGIPFFSITTGRLQRRFTKHTIPSFLKLPFGFSQSLYILKRFKPDIVLGFGSYVSLPIIITAYLLKIPIVIHEQTLEAGIANKIAGRFAAKICVSWNSSMRFFPKSKTILTGNPLRKEIIEENQKSSIRDIRLSSVEAQAQDKNQKSEAELPLLYITGGSLGSHFINNLVKDSLSQLVKNFQIIHQTGDARQYKDFDDLMKLREEFGENSKNYALKKFLSPKETAEYLKKADLVVSRAGINTVTELLFLGKPSLLIPLPFSQGNEQIKNAQFFKRQGLGEALEQKKITPEIFIQTLKKMLNNLNEYKIDSKDLVDKNAVVKIVEVIKNVYKKKKNKT